MGAYSITSSEDLQHIPFQLRSALFSINSPQSPLNNKKKECYLNNSFKKDRTFIKVKNKQRDFSLPKLSSQQIPIQTQQLSPQNVNYKISANGLVQINDEQIINQTMKSFFTPKLQPLQSKFLNNRNDTNQFDSNKSLNLAAIGASPIRQVQSYQLNSEKGPQKVSSFKGGYRSSKNSSINKFEGLQNGNIKITTFSPVHQFKLQAVSGKLSITNSSFGLTHNSYSSKVSTNEDTKKQSGKSNNSVTNKDSFNEYIEGINSKILQTYNGINTTIKKDSQGNKSKFTKKYHQSKNISNEESLYEEILLNQEELIQDFSSYTKFKNIPSTPYNDCQISTQPPELQQSAVREQSHQDDFTIQLPILSPIIKPKRKLLYKEPIIPEILETKQLIAHSPLAHARQIQQNKFKKIITQNDDYLKVSQSSLILEEESHTNNSSVQEKQYHQFLRSAAKMNDDILLSDTTSDQQIKMPKNNLKSEMTEESELLYNKSIVDSDEDFDSIEETITPKIKLNRQLQPSSFLLRSQKTVFLDKVTKNREIILERPQNEITTCQKTKQKIQLSMKQLRILE